MAALLLTGAVTQNGGQNQFIVAFEILFTEERWKTRVLLLLKFAMDKLRAEFIGEGGEGN